MWNWAKHWKIIYIAMLNELRMNPSQSFLLMENPIRKQEIGSLSPSESNDSYWNFVVLISFSSSNFSIWSFPEVRSDSNWSRSELSTLVTLAVSCIARFLCYNFVVCNNPVFFYKCGVFGCFSVLILVLL